jgi:hypothetical protein
MHLAPLFLLPGLNYTLVIAVCESLTSWCAAAGHINRAGAPSAIACIMGIIADSRAMLSIMKKAQVSGHHCCYNKDNLDSIRRWISD